jgi:hypothetical protein
MYPVVKQPEDYNLDSLSKAIERREWQRLGVFQTKWSGFEHFFFEARPRGKR